MFFVVVAFCAAQSQQLGRIAILPFTGGGTVDEREGIAEFFSLSQQIMQNFSVITRTSAMTDAISREQGFQHSGMTDADTIARLGQQFGAQYIMAGSITAIGGSKLLIVSIVRIDVIQQVAGDFIIYDTLNELGANNLAIINKIAGNLIDIMRKTSEERERLAVIPVQFSGGVNEADGDALAQILSIHLIRNGKYTVFPRTKSLDQVQEEHKTQMSGVTREDQTVGLGRGANPEFVLSIASRRIGTDNWFNASVINLETAETIGGVPEQYATLSDGITAMDFLARQLSGIQISDRERRQRATGVSDADAARRRQEAAIEAAMKRAESREKFAQSSGVEIGGFWGIDVANQIEIPTGDVDEEGKPIKERKTIYSGGPLVELRLGGYFGIATGLNIIGIRNEFEHDTGTDIIEGTMLQLPILARVTIPFSTYFVTPYVGVGIGLFSPLHGIGDITVKDLSPVGIIAGLDFGLHFSGFKLYIGFQYNGDLADNVIVYKGKEQAFRNSLASITLGAAYYIPFRSDD